MRLTNSREGRVFPLSFNAQLIKLLTEMVTLLRAQEPKADAPPPSEPSEPALPPGRRNILRECAGVRSGMNARSAMNSTNANAVPAGGFWYSCLSASVVPPAPIVAPRLHARRARRSRLNVRIAHDGCFADSFLRTINSRLWYSVWGCVELCVCFDLISLRARAIALDEGAQVRFSIIADATNGDRGREVAQLQTPLCNRGLLQRSINASARPCPHHRAPFTASCSAFSLASRSASPNGKAANPALTAALVG
jgi:hypothetical protein